MSSKTLTLDCPEQLKQDLCAAIRLYAQAAYPAGGSECAQVARETLMDTARSIDEQFAVSGRAEISRRLRAQLMAALDYYTEAAESEDPSISGGISLLRLALKGEAVSENQLAESGLIT